MTTVCSPSGTPASSAAPAASVVAEISVPLTETAAPATGSRVSRSLTVTLKRPWPKASGAASRIVKIRRTSLMLPFALMQ
jgi:hypothetical protein